MRCRDDPIDEYNPPPTRRGLQGCDVEITPEVRLDGVDGVIASALLRARSGLTGSLDLACSLSGTELRERREEWRSIEAALVERTERDGVSRLPTAASPELRQRLERLSNSSASAAPVRGGELREDGALLRMRITAT